MELRRSLSRHRGTFARSQVFEPQILEPTAWKPCENVEAGSESDEPTTPLTVAKPGIGTPHRDHLPSGDCACLGDGQLQKIVIQSVVPHPSTMSRGCDTHVPRPFCR